MASPEQLAYEKGMEYGSKIGNQFNGLTPAEHERLTILFEEMAEATQMIGKTLRHGYESYNPFDNLRTTNRRLLETEVGHVAYAIHALASTGDLDADRVMYSRDKKAESIKKYLHHQEPGPTQWSPDNGDVQRRSRFEIPGFKKIDSRFDTEPTPPFIVKGTLPVDRWQHDWIAQGNSYDPYSVCKRCSLSDTYVNHFLKGVYALCKVKP